VARVTQARRFAADSRTLHLLLLLAPFVAVVAATAGLTHDFFVYQSYDELTHFSIVQSFAHSWPHPLLSGYPSWSAPLVYWLLATAARPFGTSLVATRLLVALMSWLTCVVAYVIFRDRLGARPPVSLALALMLALSPFFFGESFFVLTDNPAWLLVALALERLLAYAGDPRELKLVVFAALAAVATLVRQVTVWVFLPAAFAVAGARVEPKRRFWGVVILLLGVVPLVVLLVAWGAPLPSGTGQADPAVYRLRNVCFSLAVVGLWSLLLTPADDVRPGVTRLGSRGGVVVALAAVGGVAALLAGVMDSMRGGDPFGIGLVGRMSETWSTVAGTSVVWWVLVPLGAAALAALFVLRWDTVADRVVVVALAAVVLSAAANTAWYQRYVDFAVLLLLGCLVASGHGRVRPLDVLRWAGVVVVSVIWAAVLAGS
jgi:hypothetical protein